MNTNLQKRHLNNPLVKKIWDEIPPQAQSNLRIVEESPVELTIEEMNCRDKSLAISILINLRKVELCYFYNLLIPGDDDKDKYIYYSIDTEFDKIQWHIQNYFCQQSGIAN